MRIIQQKQVKARKEYKCKICKKDIKISESHINTRFVTEDDKLESARMCELCFGNLWRDCKTCELAYVDGRCSNECEESVVY